MNFKKTWKRANDGFTLVELIVVIAILAILAGIAVPAYSGYIKKANEAADYQVLAAVNTAFAAAAMDADNISISSQPNGAYTFNVASMTPSKYQEEFALYFSGGSGSFKEITALKFEGGQFVKLELSSGMTGLLTLLTGESNKQNIENLMASGFYTYDGLGMDDVTVKVDDIASLAASLSGNGNFIEQLMTDSDNLSALANALGYDYSDPKFPEKMQSVMSARAEKVDTSKIQGYDQLSPEEQEEKKLEIAEKEILANNLVLQVANGTKDIDTTTVLGTLSSTTNFVDLMKNDENGVTNAAMAYGLYTAYAHSLEEGEARDAAIAKTNDPVTLLKAMDDQGFKDYLNNTDGSGKAQKDLDGYLAALDMMSQAQDDPGAVEEVLVNGFNNDALLSVLQQATVSK